MHLADRSLITGGGRDPPTCSAHRSEISPAFFFRVVGRLAKQSLQQRIRDALLVGRNHLHCCLVHCIFFLLIYCRDIIMATLIITVNLECCRCSSKIQKILCCIQQGEFVIEKIVYEKDKVFVTGPFDANKLSSKLWCKAGRIIKNIEVAKPTPKKSPEPPKPPKPEPLSCKLIYPYYPYPFPCPQPGAWPCSCPMPHCGCQPKPPAPEPPAPPPPPSKPPACQCPTWPSCYCGGYPPYQPLPTTMPYPMIVCDDSPPYGACTVM
ncbi:protein PYRICULARIA ORYZAE RESISTANCE 21 isoform X2 [Sorghum bicolor]|uniref:protein PYRICULARIA ORYZAE RESISTANCE 21 isoform X2 n=1 Tax=Sorghum bicolor TaxID=4558 RepID=UPI000B425B0F|nr:protein PYRICULARIA ORYZAE RESISTANCE 21 isoform X2 [Sorghum bicolor]|eukprot:XP_021318403.1 protein PYRICULARIA ORYZAE RESISTANCE 21 isoform X2 [Sorghum bicolor]